MCFASQRQNTLLGKSNASQLQLLSLWKCCQGLVSTLFKILQELFRQQQR